MNRPSPDAFSALSDPTRRRIVEMLATGGAQRVADIADNFDMSRQAVTKHLDVLDRTGVLITERRGRERFNSLAQNAFDPVREWLAHYDRFWNERLNALRQIIEEGDAP